MYQIAGEEIPFIINNEYRCEMIQFYDMELKSIKEAPCLAFKKAIQNMNGII